MAKLVDVPDLGSGAARRVGSSPITRTKKSPDFSQGFFLCIGSEVYPDTSESPITRTEVQMRVWTFLSF